MTDFLLRMVSCSAALTLLVAIIAAVKKLLGRRLTAAAHYYLWTVLFVSAAAAFLPHPALFLKVWSGKGSALLSSGAGTAAGESTAAFKDFAVNMPKETFHTLALAFFILWLSGAAFMLLRLFYGTVKSLRLRNSSRIADIPSFQEKIEDCRSLVGIRRSVPVFFSRSIRTPVTAGLFRPFILLPEKDFPDARYILLHELVHCKRGDHVVNGLMQILLVINWFNPAVWYAENQMRKDREISCDDRVLAILDQKEHKKYGHAVISWAAAENSSLIGMGSPGKRLKQRIFHIASYKKPGQTAKKFSAGLLAAFFLCTFFLTPSYGSSAKSYDEETGKAIYEEDLSGFFQGFQGSFVLYDKTLDQYTVYNETLARTRVSPASTFKIYSALLGFETGAITPENSHQSWDGTYYSFDEWNRNQTLSSAMKHSVNWYFQNLDEKAGIMQLRHFYHRIGYGNKQLSSTSNYWMDGSLKISPMEQAVLLADLYDNKWGFPSSSVDAVLRSIKLSPFLSGKTGTIMKEGRTVCGWFIGYVKSASGPQFFALNLQGSHGASGSKAAEIAENILKEKGLL